MDRRRQAASFAALLGVTALVLASCDRTPLSSMRPIPGDKPVAKVGGEVIWTSDVKREAVAQGLISEGEPLDPASDLFRRALDEVVDERLLAREAQKQGLDKDPLAAHRLQAARDKVLGDLLVESRVDKAVNEASIHQLYDEQQKLAKTSDEIRGRQIAVANQADAEALKKLVTTGASFEALAMQRSIDQNTRFNGGDLGFFTLDTMPEPYGAALKAAKPGEVVGPFKTDLGWTLVKVEERRPEQPISLQDARPQIVRFLTYDEVRNLLGGLRKKAKIEMMIPPPADVPGGAKEPATAPPAAANAAPTVDQASEGGAPVVAPDSAPTPASTPAPALRPAKTPPKGH
ncbi:MAG: peptidylprolyl isomerase [Pseudomonadota bacterium]